MESLNIIQQDLELMKKEIAELRTKTNNPLKVTIPYIPWLNIAIFTVLLAITAVLMYMTFLSVTSVAKDLHSIKESLNNLEIYEDTK
jgi:hypothetical protein